jgi:hypothetical protein
LFRWVALVSFGTWICLSQKLLHTVPQWVADWVVRLFITIKCVPRWKNQLCRAGIGDAVLAAMAHNHDQTCLALPTLPAHARPLARHHFVSAAGNEDSDFKLEKFVAVKHGVKWQRDFVDHRPRGHHELREKTSYILMNPIRKGLCERVEEWIWVYRPGDRLPPSLG